jgi:hypothetical protein
MRSIPNHTVLLGFSLMLAACSPDITASSMSPSYARDAHAGDNGLTRHISGTLETTESGVLIPGTPPMMLRQIEGTGVASQLGRFTLEGELTLNLATASGVGTGTYTAANGDMLTFTATGQAVIASGIATVTESVTITGGTGRFEGATGSLVVVRRIVQATGVATGTIDGTIILAQ